MAVPSNKELKLTRPGMIGASQANSVLGGQGKEHTDMAEEHAVLADFNALPSQAERPAELLGRLEAITPSEPSRYIPLCFADGGVAAERKQAMRDTVTAVLYRKLADSIIESLERSTNAATKLAQIGWWLTIVGIVASVVGVVISVVLAAK